MEHYQKPFPIFDAKNLFDIPPITIILPEFINYDIETTLNFLKKYDKKVTLLLYSREMERLLLWSWIIVEKSILHLDDQDIQKYIEFRCDLPASWISTEKKPRFIKDGNALKFNPHWRPFVLTVIKQHERKIKSNQLRYPLSKEETSRIFTVLNKFYNFLKSEKRTLTNFKKLSYQKNLRARQQELLEETVKQFTEIQWQYCVKAALQLAADDPECHEKTLFIITIFYLLYPLPSELLASDSWVPKMNHFYQDSKQNWWFKVHNNGRIRAVAVSDDMLNALKRYRLSQGLMSLPSPEDDTPLLVVKRGGDPIAHIWRLRPLVQQCFNKAAIQLQKNKLGKEARAMRQA
ncbi:MAG: Phage integrase family protein, partial [Gammaproteobacteria bacterium]|nr:Phage integrase family protein [Gammaproteobacteria bacterium]